MNGVTLTRHAHGQLLTESQLAADGNETGGILLGHDLGMGSGFVVCHRGDPGPSAVRQPAHFQRDLAHARLLAEQAAKLDGSVWIGEWHTHLLEIPIPSTHDLMTYRALLLDPEVSFPRILSLIVLSSQDGGWPSPRIFAWSISASSMRPLPITVENRPKPPGPEKDHL
jgi:integrative and conjugative element protein (TIGR02256 family)